jgi:hypothetical protein
VTTDPRRPLIMNCQPSSYSGWGVYGLNLLLNGARRVVAPAFARSKLFSY